MKDIFEKPLTEEKKERRHGRKRSDIGRTALLIGIAVWCIFSFLVWEARSEAVDGGRLAALGMLNLVFAIVGIVFSGKGLRESNAYDWAALIGAFLNVGMTVILFSLYLIGIVI